MPSVDPSGTFEREVAGITFTIRELKASGVRDIGSTMKALQSQNDAIAMLDLVTPCVLRRVVGWNLEEEMNQQTVEDKLEVMDLIKLLELALSGCKLSADDKKKSE